jgi:tetratricopeptide (TPR) repeat protein
MNSECRGYLSFPTLLCLFLAAVISLSGCTNPEKAKADHLRKGEAYLKDSKFQEASLEFRSALQIDDRFGAAHWGLARAYESLQRFPEMIDELRKTVEQDPNNLDAKVKLGNYYLAGSKGKPELAAEAERLAKEVLQKDGNNIEGHILMGSVLYAKDQKDKAVAELNRAIELDPKRVESYLSLARFYIVSNDPAKAEELFQRAVSVNDNSALAHTEYGKFLVQANRQADAETQLRKAVEVAPTDRTPRFVLASFYLINRQLDKAEEAYKALSEIDKDKPESQAVLADFYSAINRNDEAIRIYKQILEKSPDYLQGRYRLAEILLVTGDAAGSSTQIEEALKKDPHDRQALLLRARLRAQGGQPDGLKAAIEDLKEVLRQEPNSRPGLYFMAQATFNSGATDQARAFAGDLEKSYPDYLPGKLMQVQITMSAGDPKAAVRQATELLDRLAKTAPDRDNSPQLLAEIRERALLVRGAAQVQLNNPAGARQDFLAARDASPSDPAVYNSLALLSFKENKPDEAIAFYESALKIDGTNFNALSGLISLYATRKELDKAHARIDQAINSNPNNASLHYIKAQVYGSEQNAQGTEAELRKALELDPKYVAAYSALGSLFVNSKQEERAIAEFKKIVELRPGNPMAYSLIGMLEDARKNYDAAAENYRKALENDPDAAIAANNLAWLYAVYGKGNLDDAVRLAQGVVQKNPNIAGFVDTLGWVYYKKNLYGAAVEQLQKAVSLDEAAARTNNTPPSASYHYHLGMALKERGDKAGARRELEASVRLAEKAPFAEVDEARKTLTTL